MKKAVILSVIAILTSLSIYRVVETYVSRASDHEEISQKMLDLVKNIEDNPFRHTLNSWGY